LPFTSSRILCSTGRSSGSTGPSGCWRNKLE
jgi:hypothetical protein